MNNDEQAPKPTDSKDFDQKRTWYSPVAKIYYNARPAYPASQINRAVALAHLSSEASVLEIGCGPGNATVAFAQNGFLMTCLEPNPDFCQLAQRHCAGYPNVEVCNTTFEEWQLKERQFDAVLSANAFHWISPEIKYIKAAEALHDNGFLILLWNLTPEPSYEIYQAIEEIYQTHAPSLVRYEGADTQAEILKRFGQEMQDSGCFRNLVMEQILYHVTYSIDQYLNLLSTLRRLMPRQLPCRFPRDLSQTPITNKAATAQTSPDKSVIFPAATASFTVPLEPGVSLCCALLTQRSQPSMTFLFVGSSVCRGLPSDLPSRERPCLKLVVIVTRNFWVHLDAGSTTGDFHPIRSRPCWAYTISPEADGREILVGMRRVRAAAHFSR